MSAQLVGRIVRLTWVPFRRRIMSTTAATPKAANVATRRNAEVFASRRPRGFAAGDPEPGVAGNWSPPVSRWAMLKASPATSRIARKRRRGTNQTALPRVAMGTERPTTGGVITVCGNGSRGKGRWRPSRLRDLGEEPLAAPAADPREDHGDH